MSASPDAKAPQMALEGVSKVYGEGRTEVRAVAGVDLEVPAGQFLVVLGPSGSGKTTLLNLIGGIESPTAGRLRVAGEDITSFSSKERTTFRRRHVGFVFQFLNLIPTLTALENVELIADLLDLDGEEASRRALADVGLSERLDHFPSALSGGEQQRVAIARALVKEPPFLLCDEPTGSLDLDTGRQILSLLHDLNREQVRTIMLVTHNNAIAGMADRVIRMRSGEVVEDVAVSEPTPPSQVEW